MPTAGCLPSEVAQGNQGKIREMCISLKISGENQGIRLTLETAREISSKLFASAPVVNRFLNMLKISRKNFCSNIKEIIAVSDSNFEPNSKLNSYMCTTQNLNILFFISQLPYLGYCCVWKFQEI